MFSQNSEEDPSMDPKPMPEAWVIWTVVIVNVILSTTADTLATIAWERRSCPYFVVMALIGPLVYGTFGYVSYHFGLSVAASIINSLVVVGPVTVGLVFRDEWKNLPWQGFAGMGFVLIGITLIMLYKPEG
jgi:hypothetical protein